MSSHRGRSPVMIGLICAFSLLATNASAQSPTPWPPLASQYRFHMIGNAHIDAPWLWPWSEAMSVVHSTFRSALDRMNEDPDFTFTASSAQFYEWVAATDPAMMEQIRKRVAEGRWDVVGGWWIEPDVNVPNGESLVRQGLYSQRLFQHLFGRSAQIGYNPDSFGHPGTLPQILKLEGLRGYVFMRPQAHEKELPADLFWWEGADGTRILAYRIPYSYGLDEHLDDRLRDFILNLKEPTKSLMVFYGAGDHGGGPAKENIRSIRDMQKQTGAPTILFSTPDRYFDEVGKHDHLPVVADDLQHHSVGCYTAVSEIKKDNRTTEAALATGEKMAALAFAVAGSDYPQAEFTAAWKKVLLMQFHDSMAGTALPEHYVVSRDAYGYAKAVADQATYLAAQKIAWQIPTLDPDSEYLVVFNPHAWDAALNVEYDLGWDDYGTARQRNSRLEDEHGNSVAHQWTQASTVVDDRVKLVFRAPVPAFGYRQFRLRKVEAAPAPASMVQATEKGLENEHLRVTFADDGTLSMYDKDSGAEVFRGGKGGARAVVLDDHSDTWSHGVRAYTKEVGTFGGARFRVLENGPLRATVRVRTNYEASSLRTDWVLYAGAHALEARVTLDWHEHQKILKFSFPVDVQNPRPTYEIAYGYKLRKAEGDEDPGQRWIDLSGDRVGKEYGLGIINDAKYGYSVQDNDLRISIVRGAVYAQHDPRKLEPNGEYIWQDQGEQTFRMLLLPHAGAWQDAGVVRLAEEFTAPVPVFYQGIHPGTRPLSASFLSVDAPNVVVSVVKKGEDGDDLIVRCYETAGREAKATVDLGLVNRRWTGTFRPLEIKTLRVPLDGHEIREVNALEQ
ncbi:MAG TPA: glycoside hydrolase family 38 C-terminal domain-containing protein [Terriglobia bacterium]|nr:glycoside hydrolase family 38 C-terminal domain-containing protein [Terriglobia bacterium]